MVGAEASSVLPQERPDPKCERKGFVLPVLVYARGISRRASSALETEEAVSSELGQTVAPEEIVQSAGISVMGRVGPVCWAAEGTVDLRATLQPIEEPCPPVANVGHSRAIILALQKLRLN